MCCIGLEFDPYPLLCFFFSLSLIFFRASYFLPKHLHPCITTLAFLEKQYRQALNKSTPLHLQQKQRSFLTFGFGASGGSSAGGSTGTERSSLAVGGGVPPRRESNINVNVTPTSHDAVPDTPEIRKYKKRFNSEVLCASLWGKTDGIFFFFSSDVEM
jgi:hypothetical protein